MYIAVDLGATNIKTALFEKENIIKFSSQPTNASRGAAGIISALDLAVRPFINAGVKGIGVASAGDIDTDTGIVFNATDNLPGFIGFDFTAWGKEYGLPCVAMNDALAALYGELRFGAGRTAAKAAMLTLGSGVGGAYAVNGRIIANADNDYARLGHICLIENGKPCNCGRRGCIEQYLSGRAVNDYAASRGVKGDIFDAYRAGDMLAVLVFREIKEYFARALSKIYAKFPFDVCIVGGGLTDGMGDDFDGFADCEYPVVKAVLGNRAGVYGAYRLIKEKLGDSL